jgi:hypothetical protein
VIAPPLNASVRQRDMAIRCVLLATLALVPCVTAVHASEPAAQPMAVAEFVRIGSVGHISAGAEVCIKHMPSAKPDWERTLYAIGVKVDRITRELLGTAPFAGLDKELIRSAAAANALQAAETANSDLKARMEKNNPDATCPQILKNLQGMSDEFLRAQIAQCLAALEALIVAMKSENIK